MTYQNLTDHELLIPNVGLVPPHGTIQTEQELHSPNLPPITTTSVAPVPPVVPQLVQAAPEPEGEQ